MPAVNPKLTRDLELITRGILPALRALIQLRYFALEVEGAEHVPRRGPMVYAANHGGRFAIDAVFGALAVADHVGVDRLPYGAVLDQMLRVPIFGRFVAGLGGFPVSWVRNPELIPAAMEVFSIQPEGAAGNRKPFAQAYQMCEWRSGFLRLALSRAAQIVPTAVIGGEECLPAAGSLRLPAPIGDVPLLLTLLPLPSRWKLVFHQPISVEPLRRTLEQCDPDRQKHELRLVAARVQAIVQATLDREVSSRSLLRWRRRLGA